MKKAPQAFRTISEVSDWLDTPTHVLRFWESKFKQIKPVKRAGGRRYYRPNDMMLLGGIKHLLHGEGQTIKAVQKLISSEGVKHIQEMSPEMEFPKHGQRRKKPAPAKVAQPETQVAKPEATKIHTPKYVDPNPSDAPKSINTRFGVSPSENEKYLKKPVEKDAFDAINAAVGEQRKSSDVPVDQPRTIAVTLTREDLNDDKIEQIEDLFYRLRKTRNRMKRSLAELTAMS